MDLNSAYKAVKTFLDTYLIHKNFDSVCEYLWDDVVVCNNCTNEITKGKPSVLKIMQENLENSIQKTEVKNIKIEPLYELEVSSSYVADIYIQQQEGDKTLLKLWVRFFITVQLFTESYKITMINLTPVLNDSHAMSPEEHSVEHISTPVKDDFLGKAIEGGLLGVYADGNHELYYINNPLLTLLGYHNMDEFLESTNGDIEKFIFLEDISNAWPPPQQGIENKMVFYANFRMKRVDNSQICVSSYGRIIRAENGRTAWVSVCFSISDKNQVEYKLAHTTAQLKALMDNVPGGISVFEIADDVKTLFVNDGFCRMIGTSLEEFYHVYGKCALNCVYHEDVDMVKQDLHNAVQENRQVSITFRLGLKNNSVRWVKLSASPFQSENDRKVFYGIFSDVTCEIESKNQLRDTTERLEGLISNVPGAILIFTLAKQMKPIFVSEGFSKLTGYTNEDAFDLLETKLFSIIHKDDIKSIVEKVKEAYLTNGRFNYTFRGICKDGSYKWMSVNGSIVPSALGKKTLYAICTDIHDIINAQRNEQLNYELFELALRESHINHWEYIVSKKQCIFATPENGQIQVLNQFPQVAIDKHIIHHSCVGVFRQMHQDIGKGKKSVDGTVQMRDRQGIYKWYHITYTTVFDDDGKPVKAIGISKDVTIQVAMQKMYRKEIEYRSDLSDNVVTYFSFNVSQDRLEDYSANDPDYSPKAEKGVSASEFLKQMANYIASDGDRQRFLTMFSRENVLQNFFEGKCKLCLSYKVRNGKNFVVWVSTSVNLMRHPSTGDIIAFIYTTNINKEKVMNSVIENITLFDYDYVMCLNLENNNYVMYTRNSLVQHMPPDTCDDFQKVFSSYVKANVVEEDRERVLRETSLESIKKSLNEKRDLSLFYSIKEPTGAVRKKKLQCAYKDRDSKLVILTRSDVSDVYFEEQRKNMLLKDALIAAEQANVAKTEFLSRMSHEIRTPMNAIIGLTTVASQEIQYPNKIADALSKIGISARFLLSLINDILDMSRIESGKLTLRDNTILFQEFISNINSLMNTQAEAKGVEYEAIVIGFVEDSYIGDALKLQQVLVNIISNAIKFTPTGGKVQFFIEQLKKRNATATLRFSVKDNGVGISEEFLPKLFEPFAQEHIGTTTAYGGTGLGLPICKNIVNMFGGSINVKSIKEVGTEFIVDIKLKTSQESMLESYRYKDFALDTMQALIVDDDDLVCKHTHSILKNMGVKAEWVSSGNEAIDLVYQKFQGKEHFDFILIDFKMPEMDGIETTRHIRSIVGPEVTIIIMTAYDWTAIESEARVAGVDMFMSKPMFQTSIYEICEAVRGYRRVEDFAQKPLEYHFEGKRILLVEDHPLNVEVARQLLVQKGFEVEVASNGLECIEMFTQAPVGHYDAILMDVRMPVMDGLTATSNLRKLKKEGSKYIPIIAMTANAFDEDVEKSKNSGMNAHLAKPIDPQLLYAKLDELIKESQKENILQ